MELLDNNTNLFVGFKRILFNFIIIIVLNLFIYAISNKIRVAIIVSASIFLIIGLVNYLVLTFRGTPLLPSDFLTYNVGADVIGNYTIPITHYLLLSAFLFVLLIAIAVKIKCKFKWTKLTAAIHLIILALILTFVICLYKTNLINFFGLETNLWQPAVEYQHNGFLASFIKQSKNLVNPPPNNYSVDQVKKIASEIAIQTTAADNSTSIQNKDDSDKPNIIAIQDESFADLSLLRQY